MEQDKRKVLYDQLTKDGYDLGDYYSFNNNLNDFNKVKSLYNTITKDGYDVGDYDTFSGKLNPYNPNVPIDIPKVDINIPKTNLNSTLSNIGVGKTKKINEPLLGSSSRYNQIKQENDRETDINNTFNQVVKPYVENIYKQNEEEAKKKADREAMPTYINPTNLKDVYSIKPSDAKNIIDKATSFIDNSFKDKSKADALKSNLYDYLVGKQMPKSSLEYILNNAWKNSVIGSLVRLASGESQEQQQISQLSNEKYNPSAIEQGLSGAASMILDTPVFAVAGGAGGLVEKGATKMLLDSAAKQIVKGSAGAVSKEVALGQAARAFSTETAEHIAQRAALGAMNQATTFSLYNATSDIINQSIGINNGSQQGFNIGELGKTMASGAVMGSVLGSYGKVFKVNAATAVGKIAQHSAKFGGELGIFTGISAAEKGIEGQPVDLTQELLTNTAQLLAMKASNPVSLFGVIRSLKTENPSVRESNLNDFRFTPEEKDELKAAGFDADKLYSQIGILSKSTEPSKDLNLFMNSTYANIMRNPDISLRAKGKLMYIVEGKPSFSVTTGYRKDNVNGATVLSTLNPTGDVIERIRFGNEKDADKYIEDNKLDDRIDISTTSMLEDLNDRYVDNIYKTQAIRDTASSTGKTVDEISSIIAKKATGEKMTEEESDIYNQVGKNLLTNKNYISRTSFGIAAYINKKFGLDIKSVSKKPVKERTKAEQEAINYYNSFLSYQVPKDSYSPNGDIFGKGFWWSAASPEIIDHQTEVSWQEGIAKADASPEEKHQVKTDMDNAVSNLTNIFGEQDAKEIQDFFAEDSSLSYVLSILKDNENYPPEKLNAIADYYNAKKRYEGLVEGVKNRTDEKTESFKQDLTDLVNENNLIEVVTDYDGNIYHVVSGNIFTLDSVGQDGRNIYDAQSSKVLWLRDKDGNVVMSSPNKLKTYELVTDNPSEYIDSQSKAYKESLLKSESDAVDYAGNIPEPKEGDEIRVGDVDFVIIGIDKDNIQIVPRDEINNKDATVDTISIDDYKHIMSEMADKEKQEVNTSTEATEETSSNTPDNTNIKQKEVTAKEIYDSIPEKDGKKQWESVPVESISQYISLKTKGNAEKSLTVIDNMIKQLEESKKKMDPIEALNVDDKIEFWNNVKETLKPKEEPVENTEVQKEVAKNDTEQQEFGQTVTEEDIKKQEAVQKALDGKQQTKKEVQKKTDIPEEYKDYPEVIDILNDDRAATAEEYAADFITGNMKKGGYKIATENQVGGAGINAMTGYSKTETKNFVGLFAKPENGGIPFDAFADKLGESAREDGYNFEDGSATFWTNVLQDLFHDCSSKGDIMTYSRRMREERARSMYDQIVEDEERAKEEYCQEAYHMSAEEYDSYIENNIVITEEKYKDFDESEYYSKFGEELHKSEEYDTTGKDTATSGSNQILQGTQSVLPEGSTESGNEGTTVSPRMRSDTTEGTLPESPSGGEQEVKEKPTIEQLIATARGDESLPETIQAREELSQIGIDWNEKGTIEDANANRMKAIEQKLADIDDRKIELGDIRDGFGPNPDPMEVATIDSELFNLDKEQRDLEAEYSGLKALQEESNTKSDDKEESITQEEEQKDLVNTTEGNKEDLKSITAKNIKEIDGDDVISSKKVAATYKEFYSQYGDLTPDYTKYREDVINAYNEYYAEAENAIKKSIETGEIESQIREASEERIKSNIEALKRDHLTIEEYINDNLGKALAGIYYTPKINAPLERTIVNDHANIDVRRKYLIPLYEKELSRRQSNSNKEIKNPTENSSTSPYEPTSKAGKEKAKSIDAEIESQRKIVFQANRDIEKARNEISNRNGLFGDTKPVELFNDTSDFSSDNLHKALDKYIKAAEFEQNKLNELISSRDKKLMDIDKAESSQGDVFSDNKGTERESQEKEDDDIRFRTSEELNSEYPTWLSGQVNDNGKHSTQISGTVKTYDKIGKWMQSSLGKNVSVLDASSGLGVGTESLREQGFNVDDVEPYPSKDRIKPTFARYEDVNKKYDVVISNAVLNVIPDDWRADVLKNMADKLNIGGKLIINVRDAKEIQKQKQKIELDSPSEILVTDSKGNIRAYQKGFTEDELIKFVKDTLGDGWNVERATKSNSGIDNSRAVVVTRETDKQLRFRDSFGGNSGYVGYSMSQRASSAREEGRYPKTDFKKEYNVSDRSLEQLVKLGIIDNKEWHHTSSYGNKTTFYGWNDETYYDTYSKNKKEIDSLSKSIKSYQDKEMEVIDSMVKKQLKGKQLTEEDNKAILLAQEESRDNINKAKNRISSIFEDVRFRFIGEKGAYRADKAEEVTTRLDNLSVARRMEKSKKDARSIKAATGWERGADGKWRYEEPDIQLNYSAGADIERLRSKQPWAKELDNLGDKIYKNESLTDEEDTRFDELAEKEQEWRNSIFNRERKYLPDYIKGDKLFNEYPELKNIGIEFVDDPKLDYAGMYSSKRNTIIINDAKMVGLRSIIIHEIQHIIQEYEGFASGGSNESVRRIINSILDDKQIDYKWAKKHIDDLKKITGIYTKADFVKNIEKNPMYILRSSEQFKTDRIYTEKELIEKGKELADNYRNEIISYMKDIHDNKWEEKNIDDIISELKSNIKEKKSVIKKESDEKTVSQFEKLEDAIKDNTNYELYHRLAGEVEARNAQKRMDMTAKDRRNSLAADTEDVSRQDQLFLQGKDMMNSESKNESIEGEIDNLSKTFNTPVEIVTDADSIPEDSKAYRAIKNGRNIKGWYDTKTGKIYIYLPNTESIADAQRTYLHEVVGHLGLRKLVGEDNYDTFCKKVFSAMSDVMKDKFGYDAKGNRRSNEEAADEYMASMAETSVDPTFWGKVKGYVKEMFRKIGIDLKMKDSDIQYMLWRSRNNLREGNVFDAARDASAKRTFERGDLFREGDGRPKRSDYKNFAEWSKALNEWKIDNPERLEDINPAESFKKHMEEVERITKEHNEEAKHNVQMQIEEAKRKDPKNPLRYQSRKAALSGATDEEKEAATYFANQVGLDLTKDGLNRMWRDEKVGRRIYIDSEGFRVRMLANDIKGATTKKERELIPSIIEGTYEGVIDENLATQVEKVRAFFQDIYDRMQLAGVLYGAGRLDNYVTHIWDRGKTPKEAWNNMIKLRNQYTKPRIIESYAEGIEMGLVPKYTDITEIMKDYAKEANLSIANKRILDFVKSVEVEVKDKLGKGTVTKRILVPIGESDFDYGVVKNDALKEYGVLKSMIPEIETIFGEGASYKYKAEDEMTNSDKTWRAYDLLNSVFKRTRLSLSAFHAYALAEKAISAMGVVDFTKTVIKKMMWDTIRTGKMPALRDSDTTMDATSHLVQLGVSSDYDSELRIKQLSENLRSSHPNISTKVIDILSGGLDKANKAMDVFLWDFVHDSFKIYTYKHFAEQIRKQAKENNYTEATVNRMLNTAGMTVNNMFGGQHWELLGMSPKDLLRMRRILLSGDWNASVIREMTAMFGVNNVKMNALNGNSIYDSNDFKEERDGSIIALGNITREMTQKQLIAFWARAAMYLGVIGSNMVNILRRKDDVDKEKELADEIRKTDPNYKSPYEVKYPDGMKWYDYTMYGNAEGQKSHLFWGRNNDGTENYARWGKAFREILELIDGRNSHDILQNTIDKVVGKLSPNISNIAYLIGDEAIGGFKSREEKMKENKNPFTKWGSRVMHVIGNNLVPWSVSSLISEDNGKTWGGIDLVMPTSKGMSPYKAKRLMEDYMEVGDIESVEAVYNSAVMNKLDADKLIEAAITSVLATQKTEFADGIKDVNQAAQMYNNEKDLKKKKIIGLKLSKMLAETGFKEYHKEESMESVNDNFGKDPLSPDKNERYLSLSDYEDIRDDVELNKLHNRCNGVYERYKELEGTEDATSYYDKNRFFIDTERRIKSIKSNIGRMKRTMDGKNDELIMNQIRGLKRKLLDSSSSIPY